MSVLQAEFSLTQVFDRPATGRLFFEQVIRENLDIGRPSQVSLISIAVSRGRRRAASMIALVPDGQNDWKPHEKSMSLAKLASHVAELPTFANMILTTDELDMATADLSTKVLSSTADRLALFDNVSAKFSAGIESADWAKVPARGHFVPARRCICQAGRRRCCARWASAIWRTTARNSASIFACSACPFRAHTGLRRTRCKGIICLLRSMPRGGTPPLIHSRCLEMIEIRR